MPARLNAPMSSRWSRRAVRTWSPRSFERSSPSPGESMSGPSSPRSPECWSVPIRRLPRCSRTRRTTSSPSSGFHSATGAKSGRRTRWGGSTRRSKVAPTSWGVSQPCSAPATGWCRSRRATRRVGGRRPPLFLRVLDARNRHHGRPRRGHRGGERATRADRPPS